MNRNFGVVKVVNKPKDFKKTMRNLWKYLYKYRFLLILALFITIAAGLFSLIGPFIIGKSILLISEGFIVGQIDFEQIWIYALLLICFYFASSILSLLLNQIMIRMSKKITKTIREDAFSKISSLPISFFDTNTIGDIISRMSYDIDTIGSGLATNLVSIVTSFVTVVGSFVMMLITAPILCLIFLVPVPLSLLFTWYMVKKTRPLFKTRSKKLGELNGYTEEMVTGAKSIRTYNNEQKIIDKFDVYNHDAVEAAYKAEYYSSITGPGVNFFSNLSVTLVCIFGTILLIRKTLTIDVISSFVLYSRKFSGPINEIANLITDLQTALAAAERVFEILEQTPEANDKIDNVHLNDCEGNIKLEKVNFGYLENSLVLSDINMEVPSGKVIAIVGPTGCGKTTIVSLLMRFYNIKEGLITIDDKNIYNIVRKDVRKAFAMVLQDTWLFEGSIIDNLRYSNKDATIEEIKKVATTASIDTYIEALPNGYDTIMVEGGVNISIGQKQLLTIARAMLQDSKMLILDEATSNVDTTTEIDIQNAMQKLMSNKTCIIIAHRLSTIRHADLIVVMKDGKIVEIGNHEQLLANEGFYNELHYSQYKT